jgi:cytidine deaminase
MRGRALPSIVQMDRLIQAAREVRERAHAPYSGFKVGAAIEDENGQVFTGCNVENASYGLSVCAETAAVLKAISEGAAKLKRIAVVADSSTLTPPCGACRQILWEFCGDLELTMANLSDKEETVLMKQIFPRPFDASFLL